MDTFDEYQEWVMSKSGIQVGDLDLYGNLAWAALNLSGEAGELSNLAKKVLYHDHSLDRDRIIDELGDILWYVASASRLFSISFSELAQRNIDKLERRYPNGFSSERSKNREE